MNIYESKIGEFAKARAMRTGETFAKATAAVLNSEEGRALYAKSELEKRKSFTEAIVEKSGFKTAASDALAVMAREHAEQHGISYPAAYAAVLETEAGRSIYNLA